MKSLFLDLRRCIEFQTHSRTRVVISYKKFVSSGILDHNNKSPFSMNDNLSAVAIPTSLQFRATCL